jgi:hypothetical protein
MKLRGIKAPADRLPGVFTEIDKAQKQGITIEHLKELGLNVKQFLPRSRVCSKPADFGGVELVVSGFIDRAVEFEDGTFGIIDFKTTNPRETNLVKYWRSLASYQYALENPDTGAPIAVDYHGLVVFAPSGFHVETGGTRCAFKGRLQRVDIEVNRPKYQRLLDDVGAMFMREELPPAGPSCDTCKHALALAKQILAAQEL